MRLVRSIEHYHAVARQMIPASIFCFSCSHFLILSLTSTFSPSLKLSSFACHLHLRVLCLGSAADYFSAELIANPTKISTAQCQAGRKDSEVSVGSFLQTSAWHRSIQVIDKLSVASVAKDELTRTSCILPRER